MFHRMLLVIDSWYMLEFDKQQRVKSIFKKWAFSVALFVKVHLASDD